MSEPKKRGGAASYRKGAETERKIKRAYEADGWLCVRSPKSGSEFDLMAVSKAPNDLELSWAAGFFDGEGTTCVNRRKHLQYLWLAVTQKDRRPLDRFHAAIGGLGRLGGPYGNGCYQWQVCGSKAPAVLGKLYPYISEPKREQARRVCGVLDISMGKIYEGRVQLIQCKSKGYIHPKEKEALLALTDYGAPVLAWIEKGVVKRRDLRGGELEQLPVPRRTKVRPDDSDGGSRGDPRGVLAGEPDVSP